MDSSTSFVPHYAQNDKMGGKNNLHTGLTVFTVLRRALARVFHGCGSGILTAALGEATAVCKPLILNESACLQGNCGGS